MSYCFLRFPGLFTFPQSLTFLLLFSLLYHVYPVHFQEFLPSMLTCPIREPWLFSFKSSQGPAGSKLFSLIMALSYWWGQSFLDDLLISDGPPKVQGDYVVSSCFRSARYTLASPALFHANVNNIQVL
jgi:hypothetical protein